MEKVPQENVNLVIDSLNEFYDCILKTKIFNVQDFMNFMEPRFQAAGYRENKKIGERTNILIIHDSGVGDFVMMTGVIREIRRIYPESFITLIVYPRALSLAECCPYVDEIIMNAREFKKFCGRNDGDIIDFYKWNLGISKKLLDRRYNICFAFALYTDTVLLMYMSGAKIRITYDFVSPQKMIWHNVNDSLMKHMLILATNLLPYENYGYGAANACFALIDNIIHSPVNNRRLEIWWSGYDLAYAKELLQNVNDSVYALSMGGSHERKHYPPDKYAELLKMIIAEEPDMTFVILGAGQGDLNSAKIIKNTIPEIYERNIIDLTNKTNYRQSAAILSFCDIYIGNDTGSKNVAAAVNCPVLEVNCFPSDFPMTIDDIPTLWHPYGVPSVIIQPKHALAECAENNPHNNYGCKIVNRAHCITQITPETLFKGFKILKERIKQKDNEPLYIN